MAINATHPDYATAAVKWSRARDVLAGEDAIKAAGEKYLPRLESQSEEEYQAYKARASFFGATGRTLEEYLDLVFRRVPVHSVSEQMKGFISDCDLWGLNFMRYARRVVREVLSVGRAGSLVLPCSSALALNSQPSTLSHSQRPVVSLWRAENIVDWAVERVAGRVCLTCVILNDGERRRVMQMLDGVCLHEWLEPREGGTWALSERVALKRDGVSLPFIPFVFHGPKDSRPEPDKLPLEDIIAANLDHYRLDADYKHGLHFTALPTAWVSGFDKTAPLRIGASTAWVSDIPGASAGFLEFKGTGLSHIERAMEKVERRMALLGARMLEGGADGEASDARLCGLGSIVASLNESLSRVLQLAQWWMESAEAFNGSVSFAMNTDLGARAMSGDEITAVVAAWRAGAVSRDTMLERLKRGEVLPDGRSVAQERALIHGKGREQ